MTSLLFKVINLIVTLLTNRDSLPNVQWGGVHHDAQIAQRDRAGTHRLSRDLYTYAAERHGRLFWHAPDQVYEILRVGTSQIGTSQIGTSQQPGVERYWVQKRGGDPETLQVRISALQITDDEGEAIFDLYKGLTETVIPRTFEADA